MIPTVVVIPTRYQSRMLISLMGSVLSDPSVIKVIIFNNNCSEGYSKILEDLKNDSKVEVVVTPQLSVYQMWNWGWKMAKLYSEKVNVAILNDDVFFWPLTLFKMAEFLRREDDVAVVYPDYDTPLDSNLNELTLRDSRSTQGDGGMAGFCFMLKGELPIPYIDENFGWYYGDDDFVKQVDLAGYKIKRIAGLSVDHNWGQSSKLRDDLVPTILKDQEYFNQKYSENRRLWWT
jgi:hypothetical protein